RRRRPVQGHRPARRSSCPAIGARSHVPARLVLPQSRHRPHGRFTFRVARDRMIEPRRHEDTKEYKKKTADFADCADGRCNSFFICTAIFKLLGFLTSSLAARKTSAFPPNTANDVEKSSIPILPQEAS